MVNETENTQDPRYLPEAQAFSACTICDEEYPLGTESCPKCHSPLSKVRRCPDCQRIVSSRHETCIYCAYSLLTIHAQPRPVEPLVAIPRERRQHPDQMKAVVVAFSVFLVIVLFGITRLFRDNAPSVSAVRATSFAIHSAALHLDPSEDSGTARTITNGTIVRLTKVVRDNTGRAWFIVTDEGKQLAVRVDDVAPPKVSEPEEGAKMLQAWLQSFDQPDLSNDAVQAVNYYCSQFQTSSHCEELRWILAQRMHALAQRLPRRGDLLAQTRDLYKTLAGQHGAHAEEARRSLESLPTPSPNRSSESEAPAAARPPKTARPEFRQYALVDAAEVQLRIPDLSTLKPGATIRTPIAKEIRVNGQLVVPSNALCVLEVLQQNGTEPPSARLTAIEFNNRHYAVTTEPRRLEKAGSIVVFKLDSSLLIGH